MNCSIALALLILLTISNYFVGRRRVLYPPFIYSAIWSVDLVVFAISPIELNQVHAITSWVITVGALVFSIGGWLTRLAHAAVFTTWARIAPRAVRILGLLIGFVPGADFVEVMW